MSQNKLPKLIRKKTARYSIILVLLVVLVGIFFLELNHRTLVSRPQDRQIVAETQPNHQAVKATVFWVGEPPSSDNAGITNVASSWTSNWVKAYGGVDSYDKRCGLNPCGFTPKENPFYFALPYNDRKDDGSLKPTSELEQIPWYSGAALEGQSLLKNRWIAVTHQDKTAYAQWEDVGPMNDDDIGYVFGDQPPKYEKSGLDVSPAVNTYIDLQGEGTVSWTFVGASDVPDGPWKNTVTESQLDYN